ncbi:HEPN domain-containing protein [Dactylosporangium salmoneum]|uniref:ApeA N-terminal domain-containing protein n=1 Tax=Dactylosporangium salmoneum TaxID=53361 RepID=A0ABN3FQ79_9ACTN
MGTEARLDLAHEWAGHWWLPEEPDRTLEGTLRYDPDDGLRLSLTGGFDDRVRVPLGNGWVGVMNESKSWPAVLGLAEGTAITLLDCHATNTEWRGIGFGEPHEQTIRSPAAFVGVHLHDDGQEVFTESLVSVEHLALWADASARPDDEPSVVVDGTSVTLSRDHPDAVAVRFRPGGPFPLGTALEHAKAVQDLVSLATHRACALLSVRLRTTPEQPEAAAYFQRTVRGGAGAADLRSALFTCRDIPFEEIVVKWWQVRQRFTAAANMVLGLRYAPAHYVETRLLTAVGAAEVMHRALDLDEKHMPKHEFNELRDMLLEHAPQEHRAWLKEKIRNDVTLQERLLALADLPDAAAIQRLVPDAELWARTTTRARNDLTHTGQTPQQSLDELIAVVSVTSAVVVLNLLQQLGVPGERQRKLVEDHPEFQRTAGEAKAHLT